MAAAAAGAQYNLRNFDEAQELFEDLLERDPHRIEARACSSHISRSSQTDMEGSCCLDQRV